MSSSSPAADLVAAYVAMLTEGTGGPVSYDPVRGRVVVHRWNRRGLLVPLNIHVDLDTVTVDQFSLDEATRTALFPADDPLVAGLKLHLVHLDEVVAMAELFLSDVWVTRGDEGFPVVTAASP